MNKKILFFSILFLPLFITSQTTLKKGKSSLKTSKSKTITRSAAKNSNASDDDDDLFEATGLSEAIGLFFLKLTVGAVYGILVEFPTDPKSKHSNSSLTKYPYFENKKGGFNWDNDDNFKPARLFISNQYLKNNTRIQGNYLKGEIQFSSRFSFVSDYLFLKENNYFNATTDYTHLSFLLNYYRVRSERFSLWYGLGARYFGSGINDVGFSYSLGTRLYIVKPISIEASYIGSIINQSPVDHFNTDVKYHIKNYTLSTGLSSFTIGSENFNTLNIGLGIYF